MLDLLICHLFQSRMYQIILYQSKPYKYGYEGRRRQKQGTETHYSIKKIVYAHEILQPVLCL